MIKRLFKLSFIIFINLAFVFAFLFLLNGVFELDNYYDKPDKNAFPPKKKARKTRIERKVAEEETWYSVKDRKPPYNTPILVKIRGIKIFSIRKVEVKSRGDVNCIEKWRFLTKEEIKQENEIQAYKKIKPFERPWSW